MITSEKILVTGGCGFIGHHLVLALSRLGGDAFIFDNFDHKITDPVYQRFIEQRLQLISATGYPVERGDTKDADRLSAVLRHYQPSKIVHLAAIPSAVLCNENPSEGFDNNLTATKIILESIRTQKLPVSQIIFFSSSMVYGNFASDSVSEESPTNPIGIYGAAKLSSELLLKAYNHVFGIPYTIVRPSALYGPRCINRRITQIFIENALQHRPLSIEGDGSDRLDFTSVDDVVSGVILMLTRSEALNQTFNLTYGQGRSIRELAQIIQDHFSEVVITEKPVDRLKPRRGTLDIEKAKNLLGYSPSVALEVGYHVYIEWYLQNDFWNGKADR